MQNTHFIKHKLLDKYCLESKKLNRTLQEAITEYKKIYGNKPYREQLEKENRWIYSHFRKNKLLDKYCLKSKYKSLQEAITEYKKIYGNKQPSITKLEKENGWTSLTIAYKIN